jgi:type 1 fimbriae regulatory protein FimB
VNQSLTPEQLLNLLSAARKRRVRDWLILLIAFWHGLRVSEVIALKRENFEGSKLIVKRLKGSLRTEQELASHENPLLDERAAMFDFLRNQRGNQRLFPITRQRADQLIRRYGELAGTPRSKRHMHVLKHTLGTLMANSGIKIHEMKQRLGHRSIASTGRYIDVTDQQADTAVREKVKL